MTAARRAVSNRRTRSAPRPPEGTPPRAELARQARTELADAVRIARWADTEGVRGACLPPGDSGTLSAEAAERAAAALELTSHQVQADWDRARLAGLVELHGDTARPGWRLQAWDRDDGAVLRGWVALFDAWSIAHPAPSAFAPGPVAEVVEAVPQLLSLLQLSEGAFLVSALQDLLEQRIAELRTERCEVPYGGGIPEPRAAEAEAEPGEPADAAGMSRGPDAAQAESAQAASPKAESAQAAFAKAESAQAESAKAESAKPDAVKADAGAPAAEGPPSGVLLDWALDALVSVGALTVGDGQARLTPLGNWAVWVKLEQICVAAQSPAGNIERSAEDMLRGCARLTPGPARDEYRAWLAARPSGSAVSELLDAARGDDALLRGLAFEALRVVGAPAEPAVRSVVDEPGLRPYALMWLAEQEGVDPDDPLAVLTREEATWLWIDTAAAVADHGEAPLLVRHLDSAVQGTVPALLAEVRAVGHPRTVQVLVALAAAHPDPALAKAVRRAAFQVHTGEA
ncbi:hypothetical protein [Streptomyces sp. NPDC048639]|uniref:hypothetical protein n=1 Tax=Streptomyces sp. NPDC048639 TaxID=3365581 RepID=UPI00371603CC